MLDYIAKPLSKIINPSRKFPYRGDCQPEAGLQLCPDTWMAEAMGVKFNFLL